MDDCETRSLYTEGMSNVQRCQSEDSLVELRSGQVENGTPSTSPPYWDTDDDDDDCGLKPSELYGKFTWKIEKFSQINKRELRSNAFEVGGYKWYILIYPQGCDVCNHLSLFLCVANHDKLLPGWSHFAQFTIAVVNKDPKKSKYSDTLHRFWKKEHDWGWKKFMELSKVVDGFINDDTLLIKAQVQVIREKAHRPFRCLDCQYRRELVRVYLSNVEQICRRFIEERKGKLNKLIEDKVRWSSFRAFWLGIDPVTRRRMSRDRTDSILKVVVKNFFVEKEVTSTLVMDSLYSGLKALEFQSKNQKGSLKLVEMEELPAPQVYVDKDMFVLADDVLLLLERAAVEPLPHQALPPKDDKGSQNRTKDGSSGEEFNKDSIERDERRLTKLGRRTVEILVLVHIFSSRIEVAYQEAVALRRQEELIREEASEQAENELKAKSSVAEKEKRSKKKQAKQKRNSRKSKDKTREEKSDAMIQDKNQQGCSSVGIILDDFSPRKERTAIRKIDAMNIPSDMSDTGEGVGGMLQPDIEDRGCSPINWDTDTSEIHPLMDGGSSEIQNDQMQKKPAFIIDDSSSTCSSDSIPSSMNGSYRGNFLQNNRSQTSPIKGKSQTAKDIKSTSLDTRLCGATGSSGTASAESEANLSLKDPIQWPEQHPDEKEEDFVSLQKKRSVKDPVNLERSSNSIAADSTSPSSSTTKRPPSAFFHQPKRSSENTSNTSKDNISSISTTKPELMRAKEPASSSASETGKSVPPPARSPQIPSTSRSEAQKPTMPPKSNTAQQGTSIGRPSSAPLIPAPRPTAPVISTVPTPPLLSRSMSATGRLGTEPSPFAPSYIPQSYRNAMMGKTTVGPSHPPLNPSSQSFVSTASMLPLQLKPDQAATKITFGSVKPEALQNQRKWRDDFTYAESSSNTGLYNSNLAGRVERLNIHGSSRVISSSPQGLGEFPHLDIINDLLDEDKNITMAEQSHQHHHPNFNRHYSFPCSSGMGSFCSGVPYDQVEQHYDEGIFQRVYGSASGNPLQGQHYPQVDLSAYANSQIDGMGQNQWPPYGPSAAADPRMMNLGNADAGGYLHELPDYSYSSGVNGYVYHRPGNGI